MQLLIFGFSLSTVRALGSNDLTICALLLAEFGGLKWTRTIDLTLIRRVL